MIFRVAAASFAALLAISSLHLARAQTSICTGGYGWCCGAGALGTPNVQTLPDGTKSCTSSNIKVFYQDKGCLQSIVSGIGNGKFTGTCPGSPLQTTTPTPTPATTSTSTSTPAPTTTPTPATVASLCLSGKCYYCCPGGSGIMSIYCLGTGWYTDSTCTVKTGLPVGIGSTDGSVVTGQTTGGGNGAGWAAPAMHLVALAALAGMLLMLLLL